MKQIKFISIILFVFLLTGICYAQKPIPIPVSSNSEKVCFSVEDSKRLVVELEKGRLLQQNLVLLEKTNIELSKQIDLLKEQVKVTGDLVSKNEELNNQKLKVLQDELEEAKKPRWKSLFIAGGVGGLITLILVGGLFFGL
jgi:hypothetical protein